MRPSYYRTNPLSKRSQFLRDYRAAIIDQLANNSKLLHDALMNEDYDTIIDSLYDVLATTLRLLLVIDGKPLPNAAIWVNSKLDKHLPWDYPITAIMSIAQDVPTSSSKDLSEALFSLQSSMLKLQEANADAANS